jgi:hypothetical protein
MDIQKKKEHPLAQEVGTMSPEAGTVYLASRVGHLEDRVVELRDEQQAFGETLATEGRLGRQALQEFGDKLIGALKPVAWLLGLGFLLIVGGGLAILGVALHVTVDGDQVELQTTPAK